MRAPWAIVLLSLLALAPLAQLALSSVPHGASIHDNAAGAGQPLVCQAQEIPLKHENITAILDRRAYVNYSLLVLEDNLTVVASGNATLSSFLYGIPLAWAEAKRVKIMFFSCNTSSLASSIEVSEELEMGDLDFVGYLISLNPPLSLSEGDRVGLNITFVLNGTLSISQKAETKEYEHELDVLLYPCTSFFLSNATVEVELPPRVSGVRVEPSDLESGREKKDQVWFIFHNSTDISEFTGKSMRVVFDKGAPLPLFYCREVVRELRLEPFGVLRVLDTYELRSDINGEFEFVDLILPRDVSAVSAFDHMGELKTRVDEVGKAKRVRITFRSPIKPENNRITLKLYYELPWGSLVSSEGLLSYHFSFDVSYGLNWPVDFILLKVFLPEGGSFSSSEPAPDHVGRELFREYVGFSLSSVMPFGSPRISISFSYSVLWPSLWPSLWACLAGLVGCLLIKLLKVPPIALPALLVPVEKVREFVEAYERRMKLRGQLSELREALRKKKISRRKYKVRSRAINEELSRLDKKVASLRSELLSAGGMVAELLRNMEVAESELASVERDMRTLEARYKRKEISSEAYRKLLRDYRRREDRAKVAIREALLRLREMIS